jgi:hypothetical protein
MIKMANKKHLVYAEDVLYKLMQHPDNMIYKHELRELLDEVVKEKEVPISNFMPYAGWSDINEDEGDVYD